MSCWSWRPGQYTFELERGPEYKLRSGEFVIESGASDNTEVTLERFVDMKKEGWWSGDLHIHRPPADIPLLMLAQDLHVAPVITWWNEANAWKDKPLPEPALVEFRHRSILSLVGGRGRTERRRAAVFQSAASRWSFPRARPSEYPPMSQFAELARQQPGAHVDIEKPFWWDMPVWVALGLADSIGLAHNHLQRDAMLANEAWGKPRDADAIPGAARHRVLVAGHLLSSAELWTASSAVGRQRVGRVAQSGGLQPRVRALR